MSFSLLAQIILLELCGSTKMEFSEMPSSILTSVLLKSLIEKEKFHILLDLITGDSNRQKDLELLELLNSDIAADKAKAITKVVYAIRCNLFHGHKQFAGVQVEILVPVTTILKRIVECLYNKLKTTDLSANHTDGMDTLQN